MFSNPGGKLKVLAIILFVLILSGGLIGGIIVSEYLGMVGFLIMCISFLGAWLSSIFLYAFGELVESSENNENNTRRLNDRIESLNSTVKELRDTIARTNGISHPSYTPDTPAAKNQSQPTPLEQNTLRNLRDFADYVNSHNDDLDPIPSQQYTSPQAANSTPYYIPQGAAVRAQNRKCPQCGEIHTSNIDYCSQCGCFLK